MYLVHWFNFAFPASPSSAHSLNCGTISICNNWITIEDVMYGLIPKARIENCDNAPPVKISKNPNKLFELEALAFTSNRGTLILTPSLHTNNANAVKSNMQINFLFLAKNFFILKHLDCSTSSTDFFTRRFRELLSFNC